MTLRSTAVVATDRAARYAKQLGEHFARKVPVTVDDAGHTVAFAAGTGSIATGDAELTLTADAATEEDLANVERVLGGHLERFGQRDGLRVTWQR